MLKNFLLLFLAMRAADLLNLAGGMWLVPEYVSNEDLGGVLPLTTFATVLSIPLFAVAMTALRESARLRAEAKRSDDPASVNGRLRSFVRGVFTAVGVTAVITLFVAAAVLPRQLARLRISDTLSGSLAVTAAFLGCVSPVYLDQLQAAKRFGAFGAVEVTAAALRLAVMAVTMPFRALAGYFAGGVAKTLVQIAGPLFVLAHDATSRNDRGANLRTVSYWTRGNTLRLTRTFLALLPYLALPLVVSMKENDFVRTLLPPADSAGYYMVTRISDLMNYISFPILFILFPYVTDKSAHGESYLPAVVRSVTVIAAVSIALAAVTGWFGAEMLALLPNGEAYADYSRLLPTLIGFMGFAAAQTIITNADAAAGRFTFLLWFVPMHLAYLALLPLLTQAATIDSLVAIFTASAALRFVAACIHLLFDKARRTDRIPRQLSRQKESDESSAR